MTNCLRWCTTSIILISLLLSACGSASPAKQEAATGPYFSLESYFQQEIDRLTKARQAVHKSITLDGNLEEQQSEEVDFAAELNLFRKADINRPAWSDKYRVDSILDAGQLMELQYTTLDTTLPTRQIYIHFTSTADSQSVKRVEIISRTETALSSSDKKLHYDPLVGYTIEAIQSGTMTDDLQLRLEATFLEKD